MSRRIPRAVKNPEIGQKRTADAPRTTRSKQVNLSLINGRELSRKRSKGVRGRGPSNLRLFLVHIVVERPFQLALLRLVYALRAEFRPEKTRRSIDSNDALVEEHTERIAKCRCTELRRRLIDGAPRTTG